MALARIITRFAQDSQPLAEDLRARGFEVQTQSPEEAPSEPADLEITLEECAPAEALRRAASVADQDVHVFIAPGAMTENLRPARVIPLSPKPGAFAKPVPEPMPEPVPSVTQADPQHADAANDMELRPETVEEPGAVASEPEPLVPPDQEPAAIAISDLEMQPEAVEDIAAMTFQPEPAMPPQPEPVFAATEPELVAAPTHELQTQPGVVEGLLLPQPEPVAPGGPELVAFPVEPEPGAPAANDLRTHSKTVEEPSPVASELEPVVPRAPELASVVVPVSLLVRVSVLASDPRMQPEKVEALPAVASRPAPVLRREPEPASNRPIWQPLATAENILAEEHPAAAFPAEVPAEAVLAEPSAEPIRLLRLIHNAGSDRNRIRGYRVLCKRIFASDKVFWRTATVAGVAAVAALLLIASVQPQPPVPASLVQSSGDSPQQVPFAKTKRSAAVPLRRKKSAPASPQATQAAAAAVTPAAALNPPPANASGVSAGDVTLATAKVKSKPRHRSPYSSEEDVVAKDTVIRYGNPPATPAAPAQKQPEVKHYSDLK